MPACRLLELGTTLKAFLVFSLLASIPGYVTGWLADIGDFRRGSWPRKIALSVTLSTATVPILIYWPWRLLSIRAVWVVLGTVAAVFAVIVGAELLKSGKVPAAGAESRRAAWITGLVAVSAWLLIGVTQLPDLAVGKGRYYSVTAHDYRTRVLMASQISRQEKLPAETPFLTLPQRQPVQLRYHYFWPMVCAVVELAGFGAFGARDATIAGALWSGIALICVIALYGRIFQEWSARRARPYAVSIALLGVTGLDIFPVLIHDFWIHHSVAAMYPTVEWWNDEVDGWIDAMLWVPHNIAGLVAVLIVFLILWRECRRESRWPRPAVLLVAAVALASAAGTSIYLTFTIAVCLAVWSLWLLARREPKAFLCVACAGTLAILLALPFLLEITAPGPPGSAPSAVSRISFTIREFKPLPERFDNWKTRLLLLPLNYFLELGVYLYVAWICCRRLWRQKQRSPSEIAALAIFLSSVAIATFMRSDVADTNDLGWRAWMPAQFILLLWTTGLLTDKSLRPVQYGLLTLLLTIGILTTLLDLAKLRGNMVLRDYYGDRQAGVRLAALADTYAWIRAHTPGDAVVQPNPDRSIFPQGLFAERAGLAIGSECEKFSGRPEDCRVIKAAVRPLFDGTEAPDTFAKVCGAYRLDLIVVDDTDGSWKKTNSWVTGEQPVFSTAFSKVFACH